MTETISASLPEDKTGLKALTGLSDRAGLKQLASHGALLLATGASVWLTRGTLFVVPAMLVHGIVLTALFAPLHECIHRTAFARRSLNDLVAWVAGFLLALPPHYFRCFHLTHHRFTQDPARDPELLTAKPHDLRSYLVQASGWLYWRAAAINLFWHTVGRVEQPFIAQYQRQAVVQEARVLLSGYAVVLVISISLESLAALWLWVVPALLGQPLLRLYLLAEHSGCPLIPDMLRNSRTTKSNALVRRLMWNMPYHAEHHTHPGIPFHRLPDAHAQLRDRIAIHSPGYASFHRAYLHALRTA